MTTPGNPIENNREQEQQAMIDLVQNNTSQGEVSIQIKKESSKEHDYRLKNEAQEANFNRWKSLCFSIAILIGTVVIVIVCFSIIFSPSISSDDKSKSWAVITLIVGGYLGYITGKATK